MKSPAGWPVTCSLCNEERQAGTLDIQKSVRLADQLDAVSMMTTDDGYCISWKITDNAHFRHVTITVYRQMNIWKYMTFALFQRKLFSWGTHDLDVSPVWFRCYSGYCLCQNIRTKVWCFCQTCILYMGITLHKVNLVEQPLPLLKLHPVFCLWMQVVWAAVLLAPQHLQALGKRCYIQYGVCFV